MRARLLLFFLAAMALIPCLALSQTKWSVNGHYYQLITTPLTWDNAELDAESRSVLGVTGHLLTITSQAENDFVVATFGEPIREKWIGGHTTASVWHWVTGEPFVFTNWGTGEPNGDDAINFFGQQTLGVWNDIRSDLQLGYLVEYDTAYVLTVQSASPNSGVLMKVWNPDQNHDTDGTTQFTRLYNPGESASVTAPQTVGQQWFDHWERDNQVISGKARTLTSSMVMDHKIRAVYKTGWNYTIASTGPSSGVPITVWTADVHGLKNGTTQFSRTYLDGQSFSLTAPATAGSNFFNHWDMDGVNISTHMTVSLTAAADHILTAIYSPRVVATIDSNESSVPITVYTLDVFGVGSGTTQFTRTYNQGTQVSMTAPSLVGNDYFLRWTVDGTTATTAKTLTTTMGAAHTLMAVYATGEVLTVDSSEPSVPITVWTADGLGRKNGTTSFTRIYGQNQVMSMTAPATAGGKGFLRWEKDGVLVGTAKTVTVTMDAAHTLNAVYGP